MNMMTYDKLVEEVFVRFLCRVYENPLSPEDRLEAAVVKVFANVQKDEFRGIDNVHDLCLFILDHTDNSFISDTVLDWDSNDLGVLLENVSRECLYTEVVERILSSDLSMVEGYHIDDFDRFE